jgi:hypothetical protein
MAVMNHSCAMMSDDIHFESTSTSHASRPTDRPKGIHPTTRERNEKRPKNLPQWEGNLYFVTPCLFKSIVQQSFAACQYCEIEHHITLSLPVAAPVVHIELSALQEIPTIPWRFKGTSCAGCYWSFFLFYF